MPGFHSEVLLVFMPSWPGPDAAWIAATEARFPGLTVRWPALATGAGAVTGKPKTIDQLPAETLDGVTMLVAVEPQPAELLPGVRFVQLSSAGSDSWHGHRFYEDTGVTICSSNGVHAPQIAEWVIGVWLMASHHFLSFASYMPTGTGFERRSEHFADDSVNKRIGILGYGAIGREVARLAHALRMEVYAYTRSEKATAAARADDSYCEPGTGDPKGEIPARWFHGGSRAAIDHFLSQDLDVLVLAVPLTAATLGLLGTEQFALLGRGRGGAGAGASARTFVINIARGPVVDTAALITALETGQISGAALDVTDPEPLPREHPLWRAPNVFITPHSSWESSHTLQRVQALLVDNLDRLHEGRPLINVVNKQLNY